MRKFFPEPADLVPFVCCEGLPREARVTIELPGVLPEGVDMMMCLSPRVVDHPFPAARELYQTVAARF